MSNNPYQDKRTVLANSHFVLNRYFGEVARWSPDAIRERGRTLANRALTIWRDVGRLPSLIETKKKRPGTRENSISSHRGLRRELEGWIHQLLKQFDARSPGLLQNLPRNIRGSNLNGRGPVSSLEGSDRGRFINTHAGAAESPGLVPKGRKHRDNWCK